MGIKKKASLKQVYYFSFLALIALPIIVVFVVSLPIIHTIVKQQAIENIHLAQSNIIANLTSEVQEMSMRLSHLIYTNDNEILNLVAGTDTDDVNARYMYDSRFNEASRLALVPISDIVSVSFYMKSGRSVNHKNAVNISINELKDSSMYQFAAQNPNIVSIGSYNTDTYNNIYLGSVGGELMLVAGIVPDVRTDRSELIEFVALFELSECSRVIQRYDNAYLAGENSIGLTALVDRSDGQPLYMSKMETSLLDGYLSGIVPVGYTGISTPVGILGNDWEVVTIVKTSDLTKDYNAVSLAIVLVICAILALFLLFSRYFLKDIINPIAQMRDGMKQVEEGDLETHISPQGNYEVRSMIHSFNAMVRRIKALITEYEQKMSGQKKSPEMYLKDLVERQISPKELREAGNEFFHDPYILIGFILESDKSMGKDGYQRTLLAKSFDRIPRFALRCTLAQVSQDFYLAYYRIDMELRRDKLMEMLETAIRIGKDEYGIGISVILASPAEGEGTFHQMFDDLVHKRSVLDLFGPEPIVDLASPNDFEMICRKAVAYRKAACALYIADEKTLTDEKDRIAVVLRDLDIVGARCEALGFVLACSMRFREDYTDLSEVFGMKLDYFEKIEGMEDVRSLSLWLNNFISKSFEHALGKLDLKQVDIVTKAKRYIVDNYMRPDLSLGDVAEYVGLNEKYFTTKFSSQNGETFQSYLTGIRIQKAKELINTTSFKMYEISLMVGYSNPEHFNRIFKKEVGISPNRYRKALNSEDISRTE